MSHPELQVHLKKCFFLFIHTDTPYDGQLREVMSSSAGANKIKDDFL